MLDHVFITVKDLDRSIAFYETALKPLGIVHALDYDGKNGPEGCIPTSRASDGTAAYSSGCKLRILGRNSSWSSSCVCFHDAN